MYRANLFRILLVVITLSAPCARAAVQVFACEPEWAALATEIAGDKVEALSATTPLQDPHYIQARPGHLLGLGARGRLAAGAAQQGQQLPHPTGDSRLPDGERIRYPAGNTGPTGPRPG